MKLTKCLITLNLLAALSGMCAEQSERVLKKFNASDPTVSKDLKLTDDKTWLADIKLNLMVKSTVKIWVKDMEVLKDRLPVMKGSARGSDE